MVLACDGKAIMSKALLFCSVCIFICVGTPANSQYYFYNSRYYDALFTYELGASAGAMNCLTDLGGRHEKSKKFVGDVNWGATHACSGLFAGINYNNIVCVRAELAWGQVSACDSILKKYTSASNGRYIRNLSFRSDIRELSLVTDLYLLSIFREANPSLSPYLITGIGFYNFHPQTVWNNSLVSLPSLHTEGQGWNEYPYRRLYKLNQLNIPLGAGFRYETGPRLSIRAELVYRWLFTDYLDDVSTNYINPAQFYRHLSPQLAALAEKLADRRHGMGYPPTNHENEIRGNSSKDAFFSVEIKCSLVLGRRKIP